MNHQHVAGGINIDFAITSHCNRIICDSMLCGRLSSSDEGGTVAFSKESSAVSRNLLWPQFENMDVGDIKGVSIRAQHLNWQS